MAAELFASSIGKNGKRLYVEFREEAGSYDVLDEKGKTVYFFADLENVFEISEAVARDDDFYISQLTKPINAAAKIMNDVQRSSRGDIRPLKIAIAKIYEHLDQ